MSEEFDLSVLGSTALKLLRSLNEMMESRDLDEITTTELLQKSGVSRSTFYRKYRDKYDLINQSYQKLFNSTMEKVREGTSFKASFYSLYTVLQAHPVFFRKAFRSSDPNNLRSYIFQVCYKLYTELMGKCGLDMTDIRYKGLLWAYLHGSLELTSRWVENGMKEPIELMFQVCFELLPSVFQTCIALYYL